MGPQPDKEGQTMVDIKAKAYLLASIMLGAAGIGAFIWIFARDFNVYLLILSPVIIVVYELPAVYVFWLYRRKTRQAPPPDELP
jgi:hypothetical protein